MADKKQKPDAPSDNDIENVVSSESEIVEAVEATVNESSPPESETAPAVRYVAMDSIICNGKRYKSGDAFDAELTDVQLKSLLDCGVVVAEMRA